MGATVWYDGLNKLGEAWLILGASRAAFLKYLRKVVVLSLQVAAVLARYKAVC